VAIPLKFVKFVTTTQVVEAFNDAFVGCSEDGIKDFKETLRTVMGAKGTIVGDEIVFYWLQGGGLAIGMNGKIIMFGVRLKSRARR